MWVWAELLLGWDGSSALATADQSGNVGQLYRIVVSPQPNVPLVPPNCRMVHIIAFRDESKFCGEKCAPPKKLVR